MPVVSCQWRSGTAGCRPLVVPSVRWPHWFAGLRGLRSRCVQAAEAADRLRRGLEGAQRCGADGLAAAAREEPALIMPRLPAEVPAARSARTGGRIHEEP